jgi:hypothetical protein
MYFGHDNTIYGGYAKLLAQHVVVREHESLTKLE